MIAAPPVQFHPSPIFDPASVQHVVAADHVTHVPGQTQGHILLKTDRFYQLLLAVPAGLLMPWHQSTRDATVTVMAGTGSLLLENAEPIHLQPGVHLYLPAGTPHAVEAETDITLIATFADPDSEIQFLDDHA